MMTKAVLYVFHGSRLKQTKEEALTFFNYCQQSAPFSIQYYAFLELSNPSIEEGVKQCIESGATEIAIIPILLFAAGHAKKDIPKILQKLKEQYPFVHLYYGKPLGVNESMVNTIVEKVESVIKKSRSLSKQIKLVMIGRGSRDVKMQENFQKLCSNVQKRLNLETKWCYLTAAEPTFQQMIKQVQKDAGNQYIFVPYLLFSGFLLKKIENELTSAQPSHGDWVLADYIGQHPNVHRLVVQRGEEAFSYPFS
ncbi:sirohydrochlorin chelatase [Bacillus sp. FJAT-47783]|uniref:sirohydrochlorin chelatase n=1 Tax=Bacillus sp. FJAT-47783 TaxID=2922712 RepID=UPI001FAD13A1|nr:sirohydrochlorin chelatase [Bacillus sp. FJAT-47783]